MRFLLIDANHTDPFQTDELNQRFKGLRKGIGKSLSLPDSMTNAKELEKIEPDSVHDALFDIEEETDLIRQIKDVLDELNIISCIQRQQDTVTKQLFGYIFNQTDEKENVYNAGGQGTRARFDEMVSAAEKVYKDVRTLPMNTLSFSVTMWPY